MVEKGLGVGDGAVVGREVLVEDFVAYFVGFRVELSVYPTYGVGNGLGVHSAFLVPLVYAGEDPTEYGCELWVGVSGVSA